MLPADRQQKTKAMDMINARLAVFSATLQVIASALPLDTAREAAMTLRALADDLGTAQLQPDTDAATARELRAQLWALDEGMAWVFKRYAG